ncbi:MAG: hypothetical protein P8K80_00025 [Phycisphaerales bacterium]|nr:hypothetical protein [Phycisphaerales bacterium]
MKHLISIVTCALCLTLAGCDKYEQEKLKKAGDNISDAAGNVGDASKHAADRARSGTADGLNDLSDDIRPDEEQPAPEDQTTD